MGVGSYRRPKCASINAVRNQVDKILASDIFAGSKKLSQLLVFLVNESLEGHSPNEYSIGVDVFQKHESFDPRIDPLVRVHIGRLRNKLNKYRAMVGEQDPIEIELPPRSYVPSIRMKPRTLAPKLSDARWTNQTVGVRSFRCLSSDKADEYFCDGLVEELIHAMTKLNGLRVIPIRTVQAGRNSGLSVRELHEQLEIEAVLDGNVRKGAHALRVAVQLSNASDASVISSEMYERQMDDEFALQKEIADAIVHSLFLRADLAVSDVPLPPPTNNAKQISCKSEALSATNGEPQFAPDGRLRKHALRARAGGEG
jgi:TolB-like protein